MTNDRLPLAELLAKTGDADFRGLDALAVYHRSRETGFAPGDW